MKQISCLNYCDIMSYLIREDESLETIISKAINRAGFESMERIYIGSYFCAQYFLHMDDNLVDRLVKYAKKAEVNITLVVPIIPQKDLEAALKKIESYCSYFEHVMDEITVNDYGMLAYIHETYDVGLNMGRLFMKDYRDPRYPAYFKATVQPKIFTSYLNHMIEQYQVDGLEFDLTHVAIDFSKRPKGVMIGVHTPFCYMTVGQICEYASINKEIDKKFRPNQPCANECQETLIRYDMQDGREWIRVGRAVYFENGNCQIDNLSRVRTIYFPIEWEGLL